MQARGLENAGNTCFLNASLQVLLHLPPFVEELRLNQPPLINGSLERSAKLLRHLFSADQAPLESGQMSPVEPTEHVKTLLRRIPR